MVLRKLKKEDYTNPRLYRPIALLNTLGKVIEVIVTKRVSRLAKRYSLLPNI